MFMCLLQPTVFFALAVVQTIGVQADCYTRDGTPFLSLFPKKAELIPCGNGTNNCCLQDDECGTNLLCRQNGIGRQYCKEKDWTGCSEIAPDDRRTGVGIEDCGENVYCLYKSCCTNVRTLRYVNPLTGEVKDPNNRDQDATLSPSWWKVNSALSLVSMSASRAASASQMTVSSEATISSNAHPSSSDSRPTTSTPTPSSTSSADDMNHSSSGLSAGAGAGIGIGTSAAVVIIAVLSWLFFRERKKRRALQAWGLAQELSMNTPTHQPINASKGPAPEYYAREASPNSRQMELDEERSRHEMDHGEARQEMP